MSRIRSCQTIMMCIAPVLLLGCAYAVPPPVPASQAVAARQRAMGTIYRYGTQYDEWFVRGDASVAASPSLERGARLAAWDGDNAEELSRVAVATAVYLFPIPPQAASVTIDVGYRPLDAAQNRQVAGFLFVRNRTVEQQYTQDAADAQNAEGPLDEPSFYGDTYLLPANAVQQTVDLPTADRVTDGVMEVHISAGAGQAFDLQYVQVRAFATPAPIVVYTAPPAAPPPPPPGQVTTTVMVEAAPDPYAYTYNYYYIGPWYSQQRNRGIVYTFFPGDIHPYWYGGWTTYRACFFDRHPWLLRPPTYRHVAFDRDWDDRRNRAPRYSATVVSVAAVNTVTVYQNNWYVRNFHVDVRHTTRPDLTASVRARRVILTPARHDDFQRAVKDVSVRTDQANRAVKKDLGDRFQERARAWHANPAQAKADIAHETRRVPELNDAIKRVRATPAPQPVSPGGKPKPPFAGGPKERPSPALVPAPMPTPVPVTPPVATVPPRETPPAATPVPTPTPRRGKGTLSPKDREPAVTAPTLPSPTPTPVMPPKVTPTPTPTPAPIATVPPRETPPAATPVPTPTPRRGKGTLSPKDREPAVTAPTPPAPTPAPAMPPKVRPTPMPTPAPVAPPVVTVPPRETPPAATPVPTPTPRRGKGTLSPKDREPVGAAPALPVPAPTPIVTPPASAPATPTPRIAPRAPAPTPAMPPPAATVAPTAQDPARAVDRTRPATGRGEPAGGSGIAAKPQGAGGTGKVPPGTVVAPNAPLSDEDQPK